LCDRACPRTAFVGSGHTVLLGLPGPTPPVEVRWRSRNRFPKVPFCSFLSGLRAAGPKSPSLDLCTLVRRHFKRASPPLPSRRPQGVHVGPGEGHAPAWTLDGLVDLHLYVSFNPNAYGEVLHTARDISILDVHSSVVEVRVPKKVRPLEERSPWAAVMVSFQTTVAVGSPVLICFFI